MGAEKIAKKSEPAATEDLAHVWAQAVEIVKSRRPLSRTLLPAASFLGADGSELRIGFPPDQKSAMNQLDWSNNRSFLEAVLKELTGENWKLKFTIDESLPATAQAAGAADNRGSFKDDTLVQEALEIFEGKIKPVTT